VARVFVFPDPLHQSEGLRQVAARVGGFFARQRRATHLRRKKSLKALQRSMKAAKKPHLARRVRAAAKLSGIRAARSHRGERVLKRAAGSRKPRKFRRERVIGPKTATRRYKRAEKHYYSLRNRKFGQPRHPIGSAGEKPGVWRALDRADAAHRKMTAAVKHAKLRRFRK
jgi:hypothetical protein